MAIHPTSESVVDLPPTPAFTRLAHHARLHSRLSLPVQARQGPFVITNPLTIEKFDQALSTDDADAMGCNFSRRLSRPPSVDKQPIAATLPAQSLEGLHVRPTNVP